MSKPWIRVEPWLPIDVPLEHRTSVRAICEALEPATQKRYQPIGHSTFCNIFVWDVTRAAGCEVPHWYNPGTDRATTVGTGFEMTANRMHDWLERRWTEVDEGDAKEAINRGHVVVVSWKNPAGIGHVAVLLEDGTIAQAGAHNFVGKSVAAGFGGHSPSFFVSPGPHSQQGAAP